MTTQAKPKKLRTWFTGVLETRTALHLGSGTSLSTATDAPILRGADGRPLIPGSSVKGALRSVSERLLRALGERACLVFAGKSTGKSGDAAHTLLDPTLECLTTDAEASRLFFDLKNGEVDGEGEKARRANRIFRPPAEWSQGEGGPWKGFGQDPARQLHILETNRKLCRACLTWGSPFLAGRVRVPDLRLREGAGESGWGGVTELRDGVGMDRDTGTAAERIKFDLEALPAGARFDFELVAEPEADLAVVALAVGELRQGNIPLGGRVTRGLGEVALDDFAIHQVDLADPAQLVGYLARGKRRTTTGAEADDRLDAILSGLMEGRDAA